MSKTVKTISIAFLVLILLACATMFVQTNLVFAEESNQTAAEASDSNLTADQNNAQDNTKSSKAFAAAIAVGLAAALGAVAMGIAIAKSNEAIARQPESASQIRSGLMLGLVFIETAIIYALIVAILIIFVL